MRCGISLWVTTRRTLVEHTESASPRLSGHGADMPGRQPRARSRPKKTVAAHFFGLVLRSLSASCSMSAATKTGHYDAIDASTTTASPSSTVARQAALSRIMAASLLAWYLVAIQSLDTDCT